MVPLVKKSSRNVCMLSRSTKLNLEQAAEIKNQVQTAKYSLEAQQHRAATASKEVAELPQERRDSVKV